MTGTEVINLISVCLEWTVMSNGIINLSIYNLADNVVVCMLGLSDWCSGNEDHSQFPWPSFNSHSLVYIQFLQSTLVRSCWFPFCFFAPGCGGWPYLWGRGGVWHLSLPGARCNLSAPFSSSPASSDVHETSACQQQRCVGHLVQTPYELSHFYRAPVASSWRYRACESLQPSRRAKGLVPWVSQPGVNQSCLVPYGGWGRTGTGPKNQTNAIPRRFPNFDCIICLANQNLFINCSGLSSKW